MTAALASGGFGFDRTEASAIVAFTPRASTRVAPGGGWRSPLGYDARFSWRGVHLGGSHQIALSALAGTKLRSSSDSSQRHGTGCSSAIRRSSATYPEGGGGGTWVRDLLYGSNIGATIGQIVNGVLGEKVGWHWGFGAAGVGMLVGLVVYTLRAPRTLGTIGMEPTRDPDAERQARQERNVKLTLVAGLSALVLAIVLVATGAVRVSAALSRNR